MAKKRIIKILGITASVGLFTLALVACGGAGDVLPTYVGGAACAACHVEQTQLWAGSHHDLAMQVAGDETVLGDFSGSTFTHDGVESTFFRRDSSFMVRTEGPQDTTQDFEIGYTFGATPLQQYLIELPGGRLQAFGVAWDARPSDAGGQRWFHLFPDDGSRAGDPLHWAGSNQTWNYMCAACHSTNLAKNYDPSSNTYQTTWSEIDVSCEACHGPGSQHVAWAEQGDGDPTEVPGDDGLTVHLGDDATGQWRLNDGEGVAQRTAPRSSDAEIDTCAQCHSRRQSTTNAFQPADGFLNGHRPALLDEGLYHADGQIQDEVYVHGSFLQSAMYGAGVTCTDCHDPHSQRLRDDGNQLCSRCHASATYDASEHHFHPADSPGGQCVECHMPAQTYMTVDPRRDHSLRVPRPDLSVAIGTPNACTQCHVDESAEWADRSVRDWYGDDREAHYGQVLHAGRSGTPTAGGDLSRLAVDATQPAIVRATALTLLAGYETADLSNILGRTLADSDAIVRLGAVRAGEGLPPDERYAILSQHLDDPVRSVRDEIGRVLAPVPATSVRAADRESVDRVIAGHIESQLANGDRAESHFNLSNTYAGMRRLPAADSALQRALALDSTLIPAYVNLAELRRVQGRDIEGETFLRRAVGLDPDNAFARHALGLLLVRLGQSSEALGELALAADIAPANARFAFVYGVALHSSGEPDRAYDALEEASTRHPNDLDILQMLLSIDQERADVEAAIRHLRRILEVVPNDQNAQDLLDRLLAAGN